jgi:hypothetical protein
VQTDKLAVLRDLTIENGKIVDLVHETAESVISPEGHVQNNLRPRTVLKIVLNPVKDSNINVEIWLPDADAWNKKLALQKDPTLTPAHGDALQKLFDGPRHAITGERIFCGMPLGSQPFSMGEGNLYLFNWVFGARHTCAAPACVLGTAPVRNRVAR